MATRTLRPEFATAVPLVRPRRRLSGEPALVRRAGGSLVFLIAALTSAEIDLGLFGFAFAGELLALTLLPVAIMGWRLVAIEPRLRALLLTGGIWVVALAATDLWRGSTIEVAVRGLGEVAVPMLMIAILWVLIAEHPNRIVYGILGIAASYALRLAFFANEVEAGTPWRLGGVLIVAIPAMVWLTTWRRRPPRWLVALVPGALGVFAFWVGSRGWGSTLLGAACYLGWTAFLRRHPGFKLSARQLVGGVLAALIVAGGVLWAYGQAAQSGVFGDEGVRRYQNQAAGELGVILGGRVAIAASLIAIGDSPIVGIGSAAGRVEFTDYAERTAEFFAAQGYDPRRLFIRPRGIFDHSFVLGAWVSAGIFSLAFWAVVGWLILKALQEASRLELSLQLLLSWVALQIGWDMAFSPFGGRGRVLLPIMLLALIALPRVRLKHAASAPG